VVDNLMCAMMCTRSCTSSGSG